MKNHTIYCLTNRVNGKRYIGYTTNFHKRLRQHEKTQSIIGYALRKYGLSNFRITILLDSLTKTQAKNHERHLIAAFNTLVPNGYNVAEGGKGGNTIKGLTK